jgi:serine/threonine protein phosphatase 1
LSRPAKFCFDPGYRRKAPVPLAKTLTVDRRAQSGLETIERSAYEGNDASEAGQGSLLYAIGDVHGMNDLLVRLLAAIEADAAERGLPATVVFLGDVVNRGAQTRQVLDRLVAGPARVDDRWIVLRGNHEQMMLDALLADRQVTFRRWLKIGGAQTLASYGCTRKKVTPDCARQLVDPGHVKFLAALPLMHVVGDYLFVHAGVEPGVPLEQQDATTLMTIRGRFLRKPHGLPFTVVHGHTPTDGQPRLGPGRIGVDTGAYFTGILTAVAIEPDQRGRRFISVPT